MNNALQAQAQAPAALSWRARCRQPALVSLVLLALLLAFLGGRMLLAGVAAWQAERFLQDWNEQKQVPSERAWWVAYEAAQRAVDYYPGANGEYLDRLGRILESRHAHLPFAAAEAEDSRRQALVAYRAATEARPLWPYTWTQLAYTKLRLMEFDSEFDQAFARSFELAPWRVESNRLLAEIAFMAWPSLDTEQRELAREAMRRTVEWSAGAARQLSNTADQLGMRPIFCGSLSDEQASRRRVCQPAG